MHNRTIGSLSVSAIGLGCMNMSAGYGPADDTVSTRLLNEALDQGYTFLDTAEMYGFGHNESLIGNALSSRRNEYVLATKCGLSKKGFDGSAAGIAQSCEASLKKLKTDVIDLYYLHRLDPEVPIEESVAALAKLVEEGKVREIGLSEVCCETLQRAHAVHPIAALQSEYSLWSRTPERGVLDMCEKLGTTLVPFSPLGRAFLTGKAQDVSQLPENDLRCTIARPRFEPQAFAENSALLGPFAEVAEKNGCSMAQLALAWLLAHSDSTGAKKLVPIPGTKHIEYMQENAAAGDIALDAETVAELDALINESTVIGERYVEARMREADSERD
ncbi:aldo/keto reductase [Chromatiales bacterium (ex Bugula neritina AB1)]|nr:aldo/keto reductase [Chromatiales bacterium (ex Bugula neritina AB1)]